ncbi:hypothetical protein ACHHYP_03213 [Achlya hypogyna]|uniref:LNR domain-containing protein n=1 Tax=Achlya hypogyna TaxID=1202772 RepID=A0A1V9Z4D8_ACHHY|nr:hypothetical protein ACHHYP_03213 [Achlya hypogyna]
MPASRSSIRRGSVILAGPPRLASSRFSEMSKHMNDRVSSVLELLTHPSRLRRLSTSFHHQISDIKTRVYKTLMRFPVLMFISTVHALTTFHLTLLGTLFLVAPPAHTVYLLPWHLRSVSPGFYFAFAALHAAAICHHKSPVIRTIVSIKETVANRVSPLLPGKTKRKKTALLGDAFVLGSHLCNLVSFSYQGKRMADRTTSTALSFLFTLGVSAYALASPWLLFQTNGFLRRTSLLALSCSFSFLLSTVLSTLVFLPSLLAFVLNAAPATTNIYEWQTRMILFNRYVVVSSFGDLVVKLLPHATSYLTLELLADSLDRAPRIPAAKLRPIQAKWVLPARLRNRHAFGLVFVIQKYPKLWDADFSKRYVLKSYLVVCLFWGCTVAIVAIQSTWFRAPCPPECVLTVSSWFSTACDCVFYRLNCARQGVATVDDAIPPSIGSALFFLNIVRCALPEGPSPALLARFPALFGLAIEYSNLSEWAIAPAALPPTLMQIEVRHSALTAVPKVLQNLTALPYMVRIALVGSRIDAVPLDIWRTWAPQVASLTISEALLTNISMFGSLAKPIAWSSLITLDLSFNEIRELPIAALADTRSLTTVYLDHNNMTIDLSYNPVVWNDPGTGVAASANCFHGSACGCNDKTNLCDPTCFTSACGYDNDQCTIYGFDPSKPMTW